MATTAINSAMREDIAASTSAQIKVRPNQLKAVLVKYILARQNVLIVSEPGMGKSEISAEAAQEAKAQMFLKHPSIEDQTTAAGLPYFTPAGRAEFQPFGDIADLLECIAAGVQCVLVLDDLGQGQQPTQASYMQLMDKLRGRCAVVGTTNRRADKAGVSGILEPVKSRFNVILHLETSWEDFRNWMNTIGRTKHGISDKSCLEITEFLRDRSAGRNSLLHAFSPTNDIVNQPCPRTWVAAAQALDHQFDADTELACLAGAVGQAAATQFLAVRGLNIPDLDAIIEAPDKAPIPKKVSELWATISGLAMRVTQDNFAAIDRYGARLYAAGRGDFMIALIKDCVLIAGKELGYHPAFQAFITSERGKWFFERNKGGQS